MYKVLSIKYEKGMKANGLSSLHTTYYSLLTTGKPGFFYA